MTANFPLQWPVARPRTSAPVRARFSKKDARGWSEAITVADALGRLQREIDLLGVADDFVLSTNIRPRLDGLPRSSAGEPSDPGAALYFTLAGKPHCLPCDRYDRVADNIAAIAAHISATRAIARYGVADVAEMFTGFLALPPAGKVRHWREVLGLKEKGYPNAPIPVTIDAINEAYRRLAKVRHADAGGSDEAMAELNIARAEALREIAR